MNVVSPAALPRAALLIDADNFHHPQELRAIYAQFAQHAGKGCICHVHGHGNLLWKDGLRAVWAELGARLMPILPLAKNTTDAALVVDALMLHFQHGIRRFAIASGDADFAPLSMQLRELGCEVWCFARMSIAFESITCYYDRVVRFDKPPVTPSPPAQKPSAPLLADKPSLAPAPTPSPTVAATAMQAVLRAVPALKSGEPQPLSTVVAQLRQQGVMPKNVAAPKWFAACSNELRVDVRPGFPHTLRLAVSKPGLAPAALAKKEAFPRRPLKPLRPDLHALRKVLLQVAAQRTTVADVLLAEPELLRGQSMGIEKVASALRGRGLLHQGVSVLPVLKAWPQRLELLPADPPHAAVRYRG